ncbi:hypothetical protein ACLM5J_19780 [Nocardioides sp. Bht2]|uniref:hypothetical protein n=1 Tax=Nocardioides sp. Bht2 TaxID=3392297 RepID=UPI0039B44E32
MAKTDTARADEAIRKLLAPREEPVRRLAARLAEVDDLDREIDALITRREETAVPAAAKALEAAKDSGWKARELADVGLSLPRPYQLPTAKRRSGSPALDTAQTPRPHVDDPS